MCNWQVPFPILDYYGTYDVFSFSEFTQPNMLTLLICFKDDEKMHLAEKKDSCIIVHHQGLWFYKAFVNLL